MKTIILKFGGKSLNSPKKILKAAGIIANKKNTFENIVVVVSAMGNATDKLLSLAKKVNENPSLREQDMLISVGERISMSLLAMALNVNNIDAISFTGSQGGIITCCNHNDAKIVDVKPKRIIEALQKKKVVIVAGFQGVSESLEITTLGRGGSDTTAVALAIALDAEKVEFYKDVKGVYQTDPKIDKNSQFYSFLTYLQLENILRKGSKILSVRCLNLAKKNNVVLIVKSYRFSKTNGTIISKNLVNKKDSLKKQKKGVYEKY